MDFFPPPSRSASRPPQPLDYRSPTRPTYEAEPRTLGLASFTLRLFGVIATIVGLLIILSVFGGIDDADAAEWLFTRGITVMGFGIALWVISVIVHRRWERMR